MHSDDSDVTLNVLLGESFSGGTLTFCGELGEPDHRKVSGIYEHQKGRALLSLGRRRHGAADITEGHRVSLIMWSYNWEYRQSAHFKERLSRPVLVSHRPSPPKPIFSPYICVCHTSDYSHILYIIDIDI